uniref:FERM domain containing kindlin 2 n=1 Tax=Chrysemys picta bellii TaxID=8478 RepID=A0A8C3IBZ2_CHRPI
MALDGIRMPDGCYADGTWELNVHVTDLNRDVTLRVTGEVHIGGVMLKLVEKLESFGFVYLTRLLSSHLAGRNWFPNPAVGHASGF